MEAKNLIGMLAGYYLSRFDDVAYQRFPPTSQADVHTYLADRIGVPASSIKLWRDEFDPIHPNSRKGWHKRKMAPSRVRMAEMLEGGIRNRSLPAFGKLHAESRLRRHRDVGAGRHGTG